MHGQRGPLASRVPLVVVTLLVLSGCAAKTFDASVLRYRDGSLSSASLNQGGLVLLPVEARPGLETYALQVDTLLAARLAAERTYGTSARDSMLSSTKADSLADVLSRLYFTDEGSAGVIAADLSRRLQVRYLLSVYVESLGDKPAGTVVSYSPGYTTPQGVYVPGPPIQSTTTRRGLVAVARIWDGVAGAVVWDRQCEAASEASGWTHHPDDWRVYVDVLVADLLASLP